MFVFTLHRNFNPVLSYSSSPILIGEPIVLVNDVSDDVSKIINVAVLAICKLFITAKYPSMR